MTTVGFIYWREGDWWLGYLEEFPDYWTQGETFEDLQEHLRGLYTDLTSGDIPAVRRRGNLTVA